MHRGQTKISKSFLSIDQTFQLFGKLTLEGSAELDRFLHWSEMPLVKLAETGLVFLLAIHLFGGLRLLALENMPWRDAYKNIAALAVAGAFFVACGFLLRAF